MLINVSRNISFLTICKTPNRIFVTHTVCIHEHSCLQCIEQCSDHFKGLRFVCPLLVKVESGADVQLYLTTVYPVLPQGHV